jgi:serine/threonine protein kinase
MENPNPDSQSLPPGAQLEEFIVEQVLGSGGFGITYLARDTGLNRRVVIKENLPSQFAWRESTSGKVRPRHTTGGDADDYGWSMRNFLKEAETLASLDHPGIVQVLRKFETNGTAYFVMPFVEGVAFDALIDSRSAKGQTFSEEELGGLLHRMLSALGYLHDRGIYHRDIKPGNILITNEGVPLLIDFGSARQRLSERSMTVVESAGYTPFEQLQSRGNVGPWSDLYALGGTLVKAITGEAPPKANDRVRKDPHQPLAERVELRAQFTQGFLHGIDKSLEVDEESRWQNAEEWLTALQAEVRAEMPSEPPPRAEPPQRFEIPPLPANPPGKRVKPLPWIIAACVILGLGVWAMIGSSGKEEDPAAQPERATAQGNAAAQFAQGVRYMNGEGVAKDPVKGVKWYRKAAEAGDARGMASLGLCYDNGTGVTKDETEAVRWYRKAAQAGDARGMAFLGVCYEYGTGVTKNEAEAVKWYRKSAEAGYAHGMTCLGFCYAYGTGVTKNEAEAVKWYRTTVSKIPLTKPHITGAGRRWQARREAGDRVAPATSG